MTNYKRFISYLYFYEAGKKMGNVGFARVETSDELCKVTIHCTTKVILDKECKVFLLKRAKSSTVSKQVDSATAQNGYLDIKLSFEGGMIEGADFNVKETQGLVLMYSKDNYIAAKWDDSIVSYHEAILIEQGEEMGIIAPKVIRVHNDPAKIDEEHKTVMMDVSSIEVVDEEIDKTKTKSIDASNVINLSKEAEKRDSLEKTSREAIRLENIINRKNKTKEFYKDIKIEEEAVIEVKNEIVNKKIDQEEIIKEEIKEEMVELDLKEKKLKYNDLKDKKLEDIKLNEKELKEDVLFQGTNQEKNVKYNFESKTSGEINERTTVINERAIEISEMENEKMKEISVDSEIYVGEEVKDQETLQAANCAIPNPNLWADHPSARAILNRFVRMYPFDDGEIAECVRLEPKDIGLLPMSAWVLGNNSFLLHSYCNFRHLLFAKKLTRDGCIYLLMVPGAHNNREQQLAKMFGFEEFKCSRRRSMRDGEFGYWYVSISFD
jgi:hypothetical protein